MKLHTISELIPSSVGQGTTRKSVQNRTLALWAFLTSAGLGIFYQKAYDLSQNARAAALGLVFPGAGFVACANVTGALSFVLTWALVPLALFAWFGAGGILFPILVWGLSSVGAYYATGDAVFEPAGLIAAAILGSFVFWLNRKSKTARENGQVKREARNTFIPTELAELDSQRLYPGAAGERELDIEGLRAIQYIIDMGLRDLNDWTDIKVIDQFQTAAIRYQLYEHMYALGIYQGIYTPNFHGYLSQSLRNTIEKSMLKKVMNFWKWETLWGKFSTNYDPVVKDDIMVTGFFLQAVMLYTANTGDLRYCQPGSLKFQVTEKDVYPYDVHTIDKALVKQWKSNPYCLFPCEPNWIYTPCNFQGMTGQVIYDRVFNTNHVEAILPQFEDSLNKNFTECDGSILPIRSELTGFTIPGLCGAISDLANAIMCRGYLDHVAKRMYAIFKHECIRYDYATKELKLVGLVGADKLDAGTYQTSPYMIYAFLAEVAGEYGDEEIRAAALKSVVDNIGVETMPSGATRLTLAKASPAFNSQATKSRLLRFEDWKNLIGKGPSATTLAGPILAEVPYPGVLVAKAYSHTSKDLDLVLYPSAAPGNFVLGVEKLLPGQKYNITGDSSGVADKNGKLEFSVHVEGRTLVKLTPANM